MDLVATPVFKTGEGVKAPWRVRFPSASAKHSEDKGSGTSVHDVSTSRPMAQTPPGAESVPNRCHDLTRQHGSGAVGRGPACKW